MNGKISRAVTIGLFAVMLVLPLCLAVVPSDVSAATSLNSSIRTDLTTIGSEAGLQTQKSLPQMIGSIIRQLLTILGIVLVLLIIYAGYLWMMAQGNTEQIDKAKKIILNATIGLIIMFAAYAITDFVLNAIFTGTGIS